MARPTKPVRKPPVTLTGTLAPDDKLALMRKWQRRRWRVRLMLATAIVFVNALVTRHQPGAIWSTFFLAGALAVVLVLMRFYEILKEKSRAARAARQL